MKNFLMISTLLLSSAGYSKTVSEPVISEGLTSQDVQATVKDGLHKVRYCYETVLKTSPKAGGEVFVDFTVSPEGKVASSKISKDTVGNKEMGECILKALNQWSFPKPKDGKLVKINYPFQFSPI